MKIFWSSALAVQTSPETDGNHSDQFERLLKTRFAYFNVKEVRMPC